MAEDEESADDKPYEATQKRLDDARKKGEVAHSSDLTTAAGLGGLIIAFFAFGADTLTDLAGTLAYLLDQAGPVSEVWFSGPIAPATQDFYLALSAPVLVWMGLPALAALLAVLAQQAFVVSLEKLQPKLNRISPIQGAKNKFGRNGLFEFTKSTVKLIIISVCLTVFGMIELPNMMMSLALDSVQVTTLMLETAGRFMVIVFLVMVALGSIDLLWQRAEHQRKHRMSHKEMTDEQKESEGDPYLKGRRRDKGIEIATNRMIADVPKSDVVIVNPTHFAVALRWDRDNGSAPVCVAKGVDEVALRIRTTAMEAGVPIRHDPPTARVLYRMVEVDQEISPEHYRAVAVAIRFADRVKGRAQPK